jgi:hypothetical protein
MEESKMHLGSRLLTAMLAFVVLSLISLVNIDCFDCWNGFLSYNPVVCPQSGASACILFHVVRIFQPVNPTNCLMVDFRFPLLQSLETNDQATALNTIFDHDDICSFDAVIVATQEAVSTFI